MEEYYKKHILYLKAIASTRVMNIPILAAISRNYALGDRFIIYSYGKFVRQH
ncbi:MAG: hypothetical protein ICV54_08015 [Nostoc sp. C3-bin3]|nr:hypothetical protein [Nostoc sp. C3-bin3]